MKMTKVGTVYQLSFMPRVFPVNCYFVEEEDSLTLIDAALPYSTKSIVKAAQVIGKPIKRIIITHAHDDHVGALDGLKKVSPDMHVSISIREAALLAGDSTLLESETNSPIRGGIPKNIQTQPDSLLKEGDRIGSLEVILSPGHTPGSISLIDTRNHSLIVGDALQTRGGTAVNGVIKPLFPFPSLVTWNKRIALESAKKLLSYKPGLLAVGHGRMLGQPENSMSRAINEAELKFQQ
ncbi:MBL fold metallo-hydrolase [Peribacillus muralis]|uniref:MBL fold metallo-hydrolase n=1 Tax=Peribacillus muralis TaxID=264697 RepID=UPI001F4ECD2D|nr:MBL fold metallo-hydrolase [Peribacillus muralis]MCK1994191.1 MBL fold metallo-hydrolase [Peribacillus muralis]MCK2015024.1 MBL fold metallo-hydrolase [Peribacillus muralis]